MRARFGLFALPMLWVACVVSDQNPPGAADASSQDASLPETSEPESAAPDARPPADAGLPDTTPTDAFTGGDTSTNDAAEAAVDAGPVVTVLVNTLSGPEADVPVVFSDALGNYLTTATTDAMGTAKASVPSGSQVTVLLGTPTAPSLWTVVGVEPNDVLTTLDTSGLAPVIEKTTTVPTTPVLLGLTMHSTYTGNCWSNSAGFAPGTPDEATLEPVSCYAGPATPALVLAQDSSFGELGYAFQKSVDIVTDGGASTVATSGGWLTNEGSLQVSVTNAPVGGYPSVAIGEGAGGLVTYTNTARPTIDPDGGTGAVTLTTHPDFADFIQTEVDVSGNFFCGWSTSAMVTRSATGTTTQSADLSQLLPFIKTSTVDASTPAQPTVSWTTTGGGTSPATAAVLTQVRWAARLGDGGTQTGTWAVLGPASAGSTATPALPAALAAWAPASTAAFDTSPNVILFAGALPGGAAGFRQSAGTLIPVGREIPLVSGGAGAGWITPVLPANGVLLYSWGPDPNTC